MLFKNTDIFIIKALNFKLIMLKLNHVEIIMSIPCHSRGAVETLCAGAGRRPVSHLDSYYGRQASDRCIRIMAAIITAWCIKFCDKGI
jgi:hypothetical protein